MMAGGTLLISRAVMNHAYYKKHLERIGFYDVTLTALDREELYHFIKKVKPNFLFMEAQFYYCCTPFMMGELHKRFPHIRMAAVCMGDYPLELAMYFILNGIPSYISSSDGFDQFFYGIEEIRKGNNYVSPGVTERISMRRGKPDPAGIITDRLKDIIRLICSGFTDNEIADALDISRKTVTNRKTKIFTSLNVRNPIELVIASLTLGIVYLDELQFRTRDYTLNPLPDNKIKLRRKV
jgi:DNA-binding NarL/FixJ family response regulator